MLRTLRIIYLGRPAREKILILALLVLGALLWLINYSGRLSTFLTESNHTGLELKDQSMWLANGPRIQKQAATEAARLDPSRTLDANRLNAELSAIASENDIKFRTADTQDTPGGQFVVHSIQVNITGASWDNLRAFYNKVEARAPYISIESFSIAANKANPAQLNASLRVSSVEIVRR